MQFSRSPFKLALLPALVLAVSMPVAAQTDKTAPPHADKAHADKPMMDKPMADKPMADKSMPAGKPVAMDKAVPATDAVSKGHAMRASKIIGAKVRGGAEDKKLGEIEDLVVEMGSGNVRYAVLEFDPGVFSSDKLFAVPMKELRPANDDETLIYKNMSKERLERVSVNKADWKKALNNSQYMAGVDKTYGLKPAAGAGRTYAASDLIGKDVKSREGKGIGEIKELVVDTSSGKVAYAVLAFDPSIFDAEKLFAFSLASFKAGKDKDDLVLNVDKTMIKSMKEFKEDRWAKLNDPDRKYVNTVK